MLEPDEWHFLVPTKRFELHLGSSRQRVEVLKQNLAQGDLFFKV